MYKPHFFSQNWSQKSRVRLIHGYICVWSSLAIHEFFQAISFHIREQLNTDIQGISRCFLLPSWQICQLHYQALFCMKFFAYCGFPNIFIHVVSPNSWVERPRLLPTFKAWLLSTCLFVCFFNAKEFQLYGVFQSDNLEKSDRESILS